MASSRAYYPGTFKQVLDGLDTVLNIVGFGQKLYSAHKAGQQQDALTALNIAKAVAGENQPIPLSGGLGEKIEKATGITLPRQTEEGVAQGLGDFLKSRAAQTASVSSGLTMPGSLEDAANKTMYDKALTAQGQVGDFKPIMPAKKTLAIVGSKGEVKQIQLPPGTSEVIQQKPEASYGLYDVATGKVIPTGASRLTPIRPYETPEQKLEQFKTEEGIRQNNRLNLEGKKQSNRKDFYNYQQTEPDPTGGTNLRIPKANTGKVQGVKWFHNPETGDAKGFAYGEQPPRGWKPIYKDEKADVEKWALDKAISALSQTQDYTDADRTARKEMGYATKSDVPKEEIAQVNRRTAEIRANLVNEQAKNLMEQRKNLRDKGSQSAQKAPEEWIEGGGQKQTEDTQYLLPKNGQMVPVDKATYDAYVAKYGRGPQ